MATRDEADPSSDFRSDLSKHRSPGMASPPPQFDRREVVRRGLKLVFVAPVLSTFWSQDALAYSLSCYPAGHDCGGATQEPCCNGLSCIADVTIPINPSGVECR